MVDVVMFWKPPDAAIARRSRGPAGSDGLELAGGHLAAALVALDLVGDLLPFVDRTKARPFVRADVDEDVRTARVRLDEAEALGRIEPFHSAGSHNCHLIGQ